MPFVLVTPGGDAHTISGVEIKKTSDTYGYDLVVKTDDGKKVIIGWSSPGEEELIPIRETIVRHMKSNPGESLDLRDHYMPNPKYFGFYGCTIIPKQ